MYEDLKPDFVQGSSRDSESKPLTREAVVNNPSSEHKDSPALEPSEPMNGRTEKQKNRALKRKLQKQKKAQRTLSSSESSQEQPAAVIDKENDQVKKSSEKSKSSVDLPGQSGAQTQPAQVSIDTPKETKKEVPIALPHGKNPKPSSTPSVHQGNIRAAQRLLTSMGTQLDALERAGYKPAGENKEKVIESMKNLRESLAALANSEEQTSTRLGKQ